MMDESSADETKFYHISAGKAKFSAEF